MPRRARLCVGDSCEVRVEHLGWFEQLSPCQDYLHRLHTAFIARPFWHNAQIITISEDKSMLQVTVQSHVSCTSHCAFRFKRDHYTSQTASYTVEALSENVCRLGTHIIEYPYGSPRNGCKYRRFGLYQLKCQEIGSPTVQVSLQSGATKALLSGVFYPSINAHVRKLMHRSEIFRKRPQLDLPVVINLGRRATDILRSYSLFVDHSNSCWVLDRAACLT